MTGITVLCICAMAVGVIGGGWALWKVTRGRRLKDLREWQELQDGMDKWRDELTGVYKKKGCSCHRHKKD